MNRHAGDGIYHKMIRWNEKKSEETVLQIVMSYWRCSSKYEMVGNFWSL